jgi:phage-related protein
MGSIYNIRNWDNSGGTNYVKNDVVKDSDGLFWYASQANNNTTNPAIGSSYWNGNITITISGLAETHPYFFWKPSYNVSVSHEPRIKSIQFGDGYEQRLKDGINNNRLQFNLSFESRNKAETTAILHFLHEREGFGSFFFKMPEPYSLIKKFVCKTFNSTYVYEDNYTIQCTFIEVS